MAIEIKNYKERKWQDVTIEECREHREFDATDEWAVAAIKNAIAYGDVFGNGLDVRCTHINEVLSAWHSSTSKHSIYAMLEELGWEIAANGTSMFSMQKDNDIAVFDCDGDETTYLEMVYIEPKPSDFYDNDEDVNYEITWNKLKTFGVINRNKAKWLLHMAEGSSKSVRTYLKESKEGNFMIIHGDDGKPNLADDGGPIIYSSMDSVMLDFDHERKDFIITEYQYWTDTYPRIHTA